MSFNKEFADNLRDARLRRGYTQLTFAQQIGVTPSCVCQYERGNRMPNLKMVSIMSHVLDMSLDDLIPYATHEVQVDPCQTSIFDIMK